MNKVKNYKLFLENKKSKAVKLTIQDEYNIYNILYTILDDEGDEIEVSYTGTYREIEDDSDMDISIDNIGDNTMRYFIEESIEEKLHEILTFKFIKFIK